MSETTYQLIIVATFALSWLFARAFYLSRFKDHLEDSAWTVADLIDIGDDMVAELNEQPYNIEAASLAAEWDQARQEVMDAVGLIKQEMETNFERDDDDE